MTAFAEPVVAWRGATGDDAPLVVLLHGRGSNEADIIALADHLPDGLAYAAVRAPIAEGGGYAWFANRGIGRPVAESLTETMAWFRTWLDDAAPAGRPVVLVGFSGGAAFAGGLILDDPHRYAGAAILFGTLPFDAGVPTTPGRLDGLPVLVAHGDTDNVIPRDLLERTWTYLHGDAGSTTTGVRDPGGHGLSANVVDQLSPLAPQPHHQGSDLMSLTRPFEIGLFTFGEITADPVTGQPIDPAIRLREFIDLAKLADQAGLDVFGVGEHHRPDFAIASPPVVLAAIAQATQRIRLTSTVTVLSTADPVKVFEDFTAVDLISDGRAEITAGRGAYTESFPLFGHDLADYDALFDEKLDLLLQTQPPRTRHLDRTASPSPATTPASTRDPSSRSCRCGSPSVAPPPASSGRAATASRSTSRSSANPNDSPHSPTSTAAPRPPPATRPTQLRVGVTSHFYVEPTSQGARDTFYPYYRATSATTCPVPAANSFPATRSMPGPAHVVPCSPAARRRSSTRSCGNTNSSATTASSPRSASAVSPSPTPPAPSNCSPPKCSPSSDARQQQTPTCRRH